MHIGKSIRFCLSDIDLFINWLCSALMFAHSKPLVRSMFNILFVFTVNKSQINKTQFFSLKKPAQEWLGLKFPFPFNPQRDATRGNFYRALYATNDREKRIKAQQSWNTHVDDAMLANADMIFGYNKLEFAEKMRRAEVDERQLMIFFRYLSHIGCTGMQDIMPKENSHLRVV